MPAGGERRGVLPKSERFDDAVAALVQLGYSASQAQETIRKVAEADDQLDLEGLGAPVAGAPVEGTGRRALGGAGESDAQGKRSISRGGSPGTHGRSRCDSAKTRKRNPAFVRSSLEDFVGQPSVKEQLGIFLQAARRRGEALDHVLFHGPPGLGKTTLAAILAHELGVEITQTSGPVVEKAGDLAGLLTNLGPRGILFVDEIHRLSPVVEEYLYPALEDFTVDILLDRGPSARTLKLNLERFTLVGATTRAGLLSSPLRARFGVTFRLDYYGPDDLASIVRRSARILGVEVAAGRRPWSWRGARAERRGSPTGCCAASAISR